MNIHEFNSSSEADKKQTLKSFCCCDNWADAVMAKSPFDSYRALENAMKLCWEVANEEELLEAFSAHPKIGDLQVLKDKFANQAHKEQGQVSQASDSVLAELMRFNKQYLRQFGFIFIICASGQTAEHMLRQLKLRMENSRDSELQNAANEQLKIMLLRLSQKIEQ